MVQTVKRLPTTWETQVRSLGQEDPLEKEMATHSSILAWRIPWTEEPRGLQFTGSQSVRHSESLSLSTVVLEKILESSLDSKEIKLVNLKGNQP